MKKLMLSVLLGILFTILSVSLVLAKPGKVNLDGEIIAVDTVGLTITIQNIEIETFEIRFPSDYAFGFTAQDIGFYIHVKGELLEDGSVLAEWVKPVDLEDAEESSKVDSAYCSGEKDKYHPAAYFLHLNFDKDIEEIMGYFCDGFGFGQISLALQTEKVTGVEYGTLLANRAEGQGWGEIWQELGYKGKPKDDDKTPPGHDKHPDKDKKDKDKGPDDDEPKEKDKSKEKRPKKDKKEKKDE